MPNRLANETSPYLLQHKDNPVDWYPWGEDAFEEARRSGRPVLLSVGYSACHWCHVMAHESFEDPEIAAMMNKGFVCIKVDREERPDVDAIYMQAVQALTGRGGWPMTVFLTPDGRPFYGGTYFPPDERGGMPGFPRVLNAVIDAYEKRRDDIERTGDQLVKHIESTTKVEPSDTLLTAAVMAETADAVLQDYDRAAGGFGKAPKFPQPMTIEFLLRHYRTSGRADVLEAVEHTLQAMASGGMYDQVGGGFHRYSTDAVWLVPHFEKMLYDNALLARVYLDAYKVTRNPFYRRIVEETLDYVLREMTDAAGGFYSTQDADSEGEEGRFFLWTPAELEAVLGEDAVLIGAYFGVTPRGNFEGSNILHTPVPAQRFAEQQGIDLADFEAKLAEAKRRLYAAREQRVHPGLDDKVLSGWNGLMLRAFADAALAFDSQAYREAAVRNADFVMSQMRPPSGVGGKGEEGRTPVSKSRRLLRTWKQGEARLNGYLEDYAMLADGLVASYAATFESRFLDAAIVLADEMSDLFWDDSVGGFFDTGRDHETLITRPRDLFDNATPSGTSVATDVLLRLAVYADNPDYERRALAGLRAVVPYVERAPLAFGRLLCALDFHLSTPQELALVWLASGVGAEGPGVDTTFRSIKSMQASQPSGPTEVSSLLDVVRLAYLPNLLLAGGPASAEPSTPLLRDKPAQSGVATAYVCERYVCQSPTTDASALARQLEL